MKSILTSVLTLILCTSALCQKQRLELSLLKNETYSQFMTSKTRITQIINGKEVAIDMTISGLMNYLVKEVKPTSYNMEVMYKGLTIKMSLPNGEMAFSSEKGDKQDVFSQILSLLIDKPFNVEMAKNGKILEVKNSENIFSGAFEQFPQLSEAQIQQIKNQLMQAYGDKAFKGNIEMVSAIFSDTPVANGDQWIIETKLESGMSANMKTTYQLIEIKDGKIKINGTSKIETADKDAYIESNGMPLKYDLTGSMISNLTINQSTGWIIEAKINQNIKGNAYIKENPQMPEGMTIPMDMVTEMTITEK